MSESSMMPQLSLSPSAPVPETAAEPVSSIQQTPEKPAEETVPAPGLDESQLTEAEKKQSMISSKRLM